MAPVDAPPLPERSGPDRVVLLARDPLFGHAYWELSAEKIGQAVAELGGSARGVLRLIDVEYGGCIAEGEVEATRGRYVLRFPEADRRYGVELGLEAHGRTIVLLRSNVVLVPPALPRPPGDVVFVDLEAQRHVLARALDLAHPPRLVVDYPNPAKPRRKSPLARRGEDAGRLERDEATDADPVKEAVAQGGSEPRLSV